jgi:hypothetical protein
MLLAAVIHTCRLELIQIPPLNSPQLHILKRGSVIWTWKYWILELLLELGIYLANLCLCLCSFCCKGILEFSTLYFIYFAPSAHLVQRWNLFQTSNFNTSHFRIQYCTLFIQYCTKCAILHTKIGPEPQVHVYIYQGDVNLRCMGKYQDFGHQNG